MQLPARSKICWVLDSRLPVVEENDGRIDFYPQSTTEYAKSFMTTVKHAYTENYIVYYSGSQNFSVWGNGIVNCTSVSESSDESLKEDINDLSESLDLLEQLRPVSYYMKADTALGLENRTKNFGFIAQEVEEIIPELVVERSDGKKGIYYTKLIPLLVDAIKSQQKEIEDQKTQISGLDESSKKSISKNVESLFKMDEIAILYQTEPNPSNQNTNIKYYIPELQSIAMINIYDLRAKQLKSYQFEQVGDGEIHISGSMFEPGIYIYNLIIDGEVIDSKQMILTNH